MTTYPLPLQKKTLSDFTETDVLDYVDDHLFSIMKR